MRWRRSGSSLIDTDLHKVWDGEILRRDGLDQSDDAALSAEIMPAEAAQWESFEIDALARGKAYSHPDGSSVGEGDLLEDMYFQAARPVDREQLQKPACGLRS